MYRINKKKKQAGTILALVLILMSLLTLTGMALLKISEGRLIQAVKIKNQESAYSAAEAGYEKAIFMMSQQIDMLSALSQNKNTESLSFPQSSADYTISFASFIGSRPVFKIEANGYSGVYQKTITAYVVQAVAGWEMGMCRIISGSTATVPVYFVNGEIIDMPIHINDLEDNPDNADLNISGSPKFLAHISLGESRYTPKGSDKYSSTMSLFTEGISFSQPTSRIVDPAAVSSKLQPFQETTNPTFRFTPQVKQALPKSVDGITGFYTNGVSDLPAVQLKFYVKNNVGYVRIYNHCTVAGYTRSGSETNSWDYKIDSANNKYIKYPIYGCHYTSAGYTDVRIDTESDPIYVSQVYNGIKSQPGAQIYVDGNVVIGCSSEDAAALGTLNKVKGRIAVVATGNIWIANELTVDGTRQNNNMPADDNPNVIGLISEGVIKVIDPGMTTNNLLSKTTNFDVTKVANYEPIGNKNGTKIYERELPGTMTIEAAMTIGGGGWGAENLYRSNSYPDRKNYYSTKNDKLIVRGTITEALRGIVGSGTNGYLKQYYYDNRMSTGILPGNIGLKGKYLLVPGGWDESSTVKAP